MKHNIFFKRIIGLFLSISFLSLSSFADDVKRCLIVASYHDEFVGQSLKVEPAIKVLEGKCEIKQFNMDSKRNADIEFIKNKALEAKSIIESWKPDVVIAIDDNASKYLVMEHFKNAKVPFIFTGVDWTAEKYGYPYSNATGMIEISPIKQLVRYVKRTVSGVDTGVMIRPNRLSADKNYNRAKKEFAKKGIVLEDGVVNTFEDFKRVFLDAQNKDFILFTNNSAIKGWDDKIAEEFIYNNIKKLIVTQSDWMVKFSVLGVNKVVEEQGEYAAKLAIEILNGSKISDFPIVANREWNIYINSKLHEKTGIELSKRLMQKANFYK